MAFFYLDKEKYIGMVQTQGLPAALTALHRDIDEWEKQLYDGDPKDLDAKMNELDQVRAFSRELWNIPLNHPQAK